MTAGSLKRIEKNIEEAFQLLDSAYSRLARFMAVCDEIHADLGHNKGGISSAMIRAGRAMEAIGEAEEKFEQDSDKIIELIEKFRKKRIFE